ncbi:MAG TPA: GNAT family N-acetyltransferase [Ilumatobacteraceae bacterium]|nr:GNAT family N-acetyltransferase [Ilumatobacteraceae bacterium]
MAEITDPSVPGAEVVTLADGGRILVRHLWPSDRDELAERYLELSPEARRLRFFNAPDRLSARLLDYLMDVDGVDRCALAGFAIDDEGSPGVGLARYSRSRDDPDCAEAAVTVLDAYQNRGIATVLLHRLADEARQHDISTFTASVMWENRALLDGLRAFGAVVAPSEPGVASVRVALPDPAVDLPETEVHRALRVFAERVGEVIGLRFER